MKKQLLSFCAFATLTSFASAADWNDLPNADLITLLKGKNISAAHHQGGTVSLQFRDNGTLYGNHSAGGSDSGKWRIEDSKLCMTWRRWTYEGCGLIQKNESLYQHLYPNGSNHLTFRAN